MVPAAQAEEEEPYDEDEAYLDSVLGQQIQTCDQILHFLSDLKKPISAAPLHIVQACQQLEIRAEHTNSEYLRWRDRERERKRRKIVRTCGR